MCATSIVVFCKHERKAYPRHMVLHLGGTKRKGGCRLSASVSILNIRSRKSWMPSTGPCASTPPFAGGQGKARRTLLRYSQTDARLRCLRCGTPRSPGKSTASRPEHLDSGTRFRAQQGRETTSSMEHACTAVRGRKGISRSAAIHGVPNRA